MTIVRTSELRKELMESYRELGRVIEEVKRQSVSMEIEPHQMRDAQGNWVLAPLIVARAQILHALVLMNQKGTPA